MLSTADIGVLFASMQAAYGHRWAHGSDAIPVWLRAIGGFNRADLERATKQAIETHTDFPPSLGQFVKIIEGPPKRANTYLPPPKMDKRKAIANRTLLNALMSAGGVPKHTALNMQKLAHALCDEWAEKVTKEDVATLHKELMALTETMDKKDLAAEREKAVEAFRIRQGISL